MAEEISSATKLERPYVEPIDGVTQLRNPGQADRLQAWLKAAVTAPDQLRQRMAWALRQIMVSTYAHSMLSRDPVSVAEYSEPPARSAARSDPCQRHLHPRP